MDAPALDKLVTEPSVERVAEAIPIKPIADIVSEGLAKALETRSFGAVENELYKYHYTTLIRAGHSGMRGATSFLKYVVFEIDVKNITTLFRLRAQANQQCSTLSMWIDGGSYTAEELERLTTVDSLDEVVDSLKKKVKAAVLTDALEELREKKPVYAVESALVAAQLTQMDRMSKREPFSISPLLVYLEYKKYEVANLRALARGKEAGLDAEVLANYLVM